MTRQILGILFIAIFIISCDNKKDYRYVEVGAKTTLGNAKTTEKIIKAINDSSAYLEAYREFCVSLKATKAVGLTAPTEFKLYNDKGEDITNSVLVTDRVKREKEIEEMVSSASKNLFQDGSNAKKITVLDSAKLNELEKYFVKNKDEFSNDNKIWYIPKAAPQYRNLNGIHCYFQTENGVANNLRLRIQYCAKDWIFFSRVQFLIDGKAYDYVPSTTKTEVGNGGISEWSDERLSVSDKDLINALSNGKSAKMKLSGSQNSDIKVISEAQINSIKRTLEFYRAMGGEY